MDLNMHTTHTAKIVRVGSSLGIIIPKFLLKQQNVDRGDTVVFGIYGERQFFFRVLTDKEIQAIIPPQVKI